MASSENLATVDPWIGRLSAFPDSWISEAYARDTDALTKALQMSFSKSSTAAPVAAGDSFSPYFNVTSSTASNLSGSEPDTPLVRRLRAPAVAVGKVTKRKSRASKRSQTTFIAADAANFRQMVQQVTGVGFSAHRSTCTSVPVLKPEPQKLSGSSLLQSAGSCLPTLDTSAFLLDKYQDVGQLLQEAMPEPVMVGGSTTGGSFDFEGFSCFPTLESWKPIS